MKTTKIDVYCQNYKNNIHLKSKIKISDVSFSGTKNREKAPSDPRFWQSVFIKQDKGKKNYISESEFKSALQYASCAYFSEDKISYLLSIIEPKDRNCILESIRNLDPLQTFQRIEDIKRYINPYTKKYDSSLEAIVAKIYEKNPTVQNREKDNALRAGIACLDKDTGRLNALAIKFLNMFYFEEPYEVNENFTDKLLQGYKIMQRKSIDYKSALNFDSVARNIEAIKDASGRHNSRNFVCLSKLLYSDYDKFDSADVILNYAKDENGIVDYKEFKKTLKYLAYGDFNTECIEELGKIPLDKRYQIKDRILKYTRENKLMYYEAWQTALCIIKYCLLDDGNIDETKLKYIKKLYSETGVPVLNDLMGRILCNERNHNYINSLMQRDPSKAALFGLYADKFVSPKDNYEIVPFVQRKLDGIVGTEISLETLGYLLEKYRSNPDNYIDFNEDGYSKTLKMLKLIPTLQYCVKTVDLGDFFEGNYNPSSQSFVTNMYLLGELHKFKKNNKTENSLPIVDQLINLLKDYIENSSTAYPISTEVKNIFLQEVIATNPSTDGKYSEFETTLINSIPYLEDSITGIELSYSREDFLDDINAICKDEKDYELFAAKTGIQPIYEDRNGRKIIVGYDGILDSSKLDSNNVFECKLKEAADKFLFKNSVKTSNERLNNALNAIFDACPELFNIVGKKQHRTHSWTLETHTLLNLAYCFKNPDYLKLNNLDKAMLKFTVLFHDIAKPEGKIDKSHHIASSYAARNIIKKFIDNPNSVDRILALIQNHHWLEEFSNANDKEEKAKELAFRFKTPNDFIIAKIIADSDIASVSESFYAQYKEMLSEYRISIIDEMLKKIYKSGCALETDTISSAKHNNIPTVELKGKKYKILDIKNMPQDTDMSKYGFRPGAKKSDLYFLVHMVTEDNMDLQLFTVMQLSKGTSKGILSESLITPSQAKTYCNRKYGVILAQTNANLINISNDNQFSGKRKTYKQVYSAYFDTSSQAYREKFRKIILVSLGVDPDSISDDEYIEFYKKHIINKTSLAQFSKNRKFELNGKTYSEEDLKGAIIAFQNYIINSNKISHNEILGCSPKINALITKEDDINQLPEEFLDFAHNNNLPIVII